MERYTRFPFLPEVESATFGSFYEFRTYFLKAGGLAPTLNRRRDAIAPAGDYTLARFAGSSFPLHPQRLTQPFRR
jgi:hypothetical protein